MFVYILIFHLWSNTYYHPPSKKTAPVILQNPCNGGWWLVVLVVVVVQFWEFSAEFSLQSSQKLMMKVWGGGASPRYGQFLLCAIELWRRVVGDSAKVLSCSLLFCVMMLCASCARERFILSA